MTEPIKGKELVERFSQFVERGKGRARDIKEFQKRLDNIANSEEYKENQRKRTDPAEQKSPQFSSKARGARRHQPPQISKLGEEAPKKASPISNKPKKITLRQAERISKLAPLIENAARKHNVPVELICGVILQESGGKTRAVSHCGARGLMQLMPATARRFGVRNSFDPAQNINAGTKYLRWLMDRFDGNVELALAGYNAGEGNVEKYGNKIPPFKETRAYVPSVLSYTQSMIDIFSTQIAQILPGYARRV